MNKLLLIGMVMVLLVVAGCSEEEDNFEIVGNSVMVNDSNLFMLVTPHTLHSSDWVELEFESKVFSGDIDFVFGFNTDNVFPTKSQRWYPHDEGRSYTCDYEFRYTVDPNYFWCYNEVNENGTEYNVTIFEHSFLTGDIPTQTAYWNETVNWVDWNPTESIEYDFADMNIWYYAQDQHVTAGNNYKIRYFLNVPADSEAGKYVLGIKPSSETIQQSIENNHLYLLDPWYDYNLEDGLFKYYAFDDNNEHGDNCTDLTGNNRDCDPHGGMNKIEGKIEETYEFVGSGDYVNLSAEALTLTAFSSCAWVNSSGAGDSQDIYSRGSNAVNSYCNQYGTEEGCIRYGIGTTNPNCYAMVAWDASAGSYDLLRGTTGTLCDGNYHYICVVLNGTGMQLWVDNSIENETADSGNLDATLPESIGRTMYLGDPHWFSGGIDEFGTWNRTLTAEEIGYLWNSGQGLEFRGIESIEISDHTIVPSSAYFNTSLNCSAMIHDSTGQPTNGTIDWYKNGVIENGYNHNFTELANGTYVSGDLVDEVLVVDDVWNCSINTYLNNDTSINRTSSRTVTVLDYAPTVPNFFYPANNSVIIGNSLNLNCSNSTDVEDQTIYYEIYGNQTGSNYDLLSNNTGGNYTWSGLTTGLTYDWQCRAWSGNYQTSDFTGNNSFSVFNLTNCTSETGEFNFYMKDETNSTALTSAFEATFEVTVGDFGGNYTFDLNGFNNYSICLEEGSMWINESMIEYSAESFDPRQYYMFNTNITNGSQTNISLYLLEIILGTGTTFLVEDQSGNPLEGYYIYIDRYDVGTNTYRTVAMVKTDENGEDYVYLRHNDAWYRFTVYYEGEMQFRSERKKISSTTQTIEIGEDTWSYYQDQFEDVLYDLSFDNTTKKYTTIFSTTSGVARNVCMRVTEHRSGGYLYEEFDQCVSSASGSLSHTISNNASSYFAEAYVSINPQHALVSLWYDPDASFIWGTFGVILVIILIAGMVMIGASVGEMGVGISLILVPVILISARVMGLITIGQGAIMAVGTLVAFIIVKMKGFAR